MRGVTQSCQLVVAAYSSTLRHGGMGALAFALEAGGEAALADRGGNGGGKLAICSSLTSLFKACLALSGARGREGKALADSLSLFIAALAVEF